MNRFRQLKQKLIKSKRDSQKLQHLPTSQNQLEAWVQQQLQYYGISRESYRLKELKNVYPFRIPCLNSNSKPQLINSIDAEETDNQRFLKKKSSWQNVVSDYSGKKTEDYDMSFGQKQSDERTNESKMIPTPLKTQQTPIKVIATPVKKIICKKSKNMHISSMNEVYDINQKEKKIQFQNQVINYRQNFRSCHAEKAIQHNKELDYYTLILQLTAQLNYSRLNKQVNNEKSILKQIKNLICYIEGKSAAQTGLESGNHHKNSSSSCEGNSNESNNKKSCHTFSSIFSNDSVFTYHQQQIAQSKRKIKYKLMDPSSAPSLKSNNKNTTSLNQHDETFKSINGFDEESSNQQKQEHSDQEEKTSIIDMVQNDFKHQQKTDDILVQEQEDDDLSNMLIDNSSLSRITEHESEYTNSLEPSLNESPSRMTPKKLSYTGDRQIQNSIITQKQQFKSNQAHKREFYTDDMEKRISMLYSTSLFKKNLSNKEENILNNSHPQNQLILKKLSDKLQSNDQFYNLFEHSLEFKRILYMLDTQYVNSNHKNRASPSIFTQTLVSNQQNSTEKSCSVYYPKTQTEVSPESFRKEILESNQENQRISHKDQCLMSKLKNIFSQQSNKKKSPKILKSESQNQHQQSANEKPKKHQRSHTEYYPHEKSNQTRRYRLNLFSQLSQQLYQESQDCLFDNQKYQPISVENQDQSRYFKISRNSYLTEESANTNPVTSTKSQVDTDSHVVKKGNFIVKKNKSKNLENCLVFEEKQPKFVVKKKDSNIKTEYSDDSQTTLRVQQNKYNVQSRDFIKKTTQQTIIDPNKQTTKEIKNKQKTQDYNKQNQLLAKDKKIGKFSVSIQRFDSQENSFTSSEIIKSNCKSIQKSRKSSKGFKSPSLNESKTSMSSSRPIKYKIYTESQVKGSSQKQDKRKVLKNIVQILNTKYNKNILIKE